jgi:hypothetical protein
VFRLVFAVLVRIPVEAGFGHAVMVSGNPPLSHINVWLSESLGNATSNVPHDPPRSGRRRCGGYAAFAACRRERLTV